MVTRDPDLVNDLKAGGFVKCYTPTCDFWISPDSQYAIENSGGGYYTCPRCQRSYNLIYELPWQRPGLEDYHPDDYSGGLNASGLNVTEVGQLGENIVASLGELPGYGPITWWHGSNARDQSSLDGATRDWGIEVKTVLYDAMHHRFIAGGNRGTRNERADKNQAAEEMGKLGILGVLVILDMRRSVADIYVKEMPLAGWNVRGKTFYGIGNFRSHAGTHLVKEVPFKNPYVDPDHPAPYGPDTGSAFDDNAVEEAMPF